MRTLFIGLVVLFCVAFAFCADTPEKTYYANLDVYCRAPQRLVEPVKQRLAAQLKLIKGLGVEVVMPTPYARELNQTKIYVVGMGYFITKRTNLSALQAAHALLADCLTDINIDHPEAALRLHSEQESLLAN